MGTDPVSILKEALKIYSPTGEEQTLAKYLCEQMEILGYDKVRTDGAGNAIGETGSGPTRILLCGHMDTVPGLLPLEDRDGEISGRGAADAKSALCALMVAGSMCSVPGIRVVFAGVTQEEGDSVGIQTMAEDDGKFDYAVFGEPAGAHKVAVGYRGRLACHLEIRTDGGHAGSPWAHSNAVDEFFVLLERLRRYERKCSVSGSHFRSLSISPTLVRAGNYHNVIPNSCEATLDVRLPPGLPSADVMKAISAIVADTGNQTKARVAFDDPTEAYESDPNSPLVRAFQRAIILRIKTRPVMTRKTGTGDMNFFAVKTGATCVTYGPGASETSHTERETVAVEDYLNSIGVLAEAVKQLGILTSKRLTSTGR